MIDERGEILNAQFLTDLNLSSDWLNLSEIDWLKEEGEFQPIKFDCWWSVVLQTELKVNEMEKMRSLHEIEIRSRETAIRQLKTEVVSTWDAKAAYVNSPDYVPNDIIPLNKSENSLKLEF